MSWRSASRGFCLYRLSAPGLFVLLLAAWLGLAPGAVPALDWEVGTRFGFETRPAAFDDPYAFSLGV